MAALGWKQENKIAVLFAVIFLGAAFPVCAQIQPQEPLGDVARRLREERENGSRKATKVFTNDNLPAPNPMEPVSQSPPLEHPASTAKGTSTPFTSPSAGENGSKAPATPEGKAQTPVNLQDKIKAARRNLAKAKEQQQLSEDELNLLQIQQVRELNGLVKADLTSQVEAKQAEVDINRDATEAAQKALDDMEDRFKDRAAPDDGSRTD